MRIQVQPRLTRPIDHITLGYGLPNAMPAVCRNNLCPRRRNEMSEHAKAYISSLAAINESQIDHGPHLSMAATDEEAQLDALAEAHRRWPEAGGWTRHHARVIEVRLEGCLPSQRVWSRSGGSRRRLWLMPARTSRRMTRQSCESESARTLGHRHLTALWDSLSLCRTDVIYVKPHCGELRRLSIAALKAV